MSEEMPEECCAKCRFSAPSDYESMVTCRRFPPGSMAHVFDFDDGFTVASQKIERHFGVTEDNDWCGEFQPRKEAP